MVNGPQCHLRLGGIGLARVRDMRERPEPRPVEPIPHRIFQGWCAPCQRWHEAPVDLYKQVLGQGRLGVRVTSVIATQRTDMRVPVRHMQALVHILSRVAIRSDEIVEWLHRVVAHVEPLRERLTGHRRASPACTLMKPGGEKIVSRALCGVHALRRCGRMSSITRNREEIVQMRIGPASAGVVGRDRMQDPTAIRSASLVRGPFPARHRYLEEKRSPE